MLKVVYRAVIMEMNYLNTPYATHCIDLILEDIRKISWVKETMINAKKITKFICNHSWVLNLMRKYIDGKEILRSSMTHFATNFLNL